MSVRRMNSLHITSQLQSEWKDSGLSFRIMLVGESGQGKSTFTRALLRPYVPDHLLHKGNPEALCARTTEITEIVHRVDNEGYPVEFTMVDCPGYGDAIDCSPWDGMSRAVLVVIPSSPPPPTTPPPLGGGLVA